MSDPDEMARRMAAQQRREAAGAAAREEHEARTAHVNLLREVERLGREVYAILEVRGFPGMEAISLQKYSGLTGRTKRKDVAAWKITTCEWNWKDADVEATFWLLKDGEFAAESGGPSYGVTKRSLDDPFMGRFLTEVRDALATWRRNLES